ncbi:DUF3558 domain-containing protein [Streptomyces xantholiticus]|uniref:DUF3558 domain-containing protein n=1 Tax=Streptomyces xantholiticus TaxID=68285 RepID=UPI00167798CF|nr:DUF3558 domain-containing protein [Streptomyces xantholiticus]GGW64756.1 hypothetical protein GCM10010381_57240 [Streptomyces xantholiticus]
MQRKAYLPGVAALLAALVTGCTAETGAKSSDIDAKANGATPAVAAPGKYRTLLEPCGAVEPSALKDLLPGTATLPEDQQRQALRGTAGVTYDTDRRVACSWQGDSPNASHQLRVDFERVVSYDPAVSDDDRAQEVFATKLASASVPIATAPPQEPSGEASATDAVGDGSPSPTAAPAGGGEADGAAQPGVSTGTAAGSATPGTAGVPSSGAPTAGLEPRVLDGLGDAAFIDDVLGRAGSTAQRRTVSVVFRTSNVIVTVVYGEQPALSTGVPDSKELQEKAQSLARKLAEQFDE